MTDETASAAPAESVRRPPARLRVFELALVLSVGFGGALAESLHHWWSGVQHGVSDPVDSLWQDLHWIAASAPAIATLLFVLSCQGRRLRDLGLTARWSDLGWGAVLAVASFLPYPYDWRAPLDGAAMVAPLTVVALLASAAREELLVRAYMMSEVLDLTHSGFLAVAASTAFQVLYHLYQGPGWALAAGVVFLVYSVFYWRTRRITPVLIAHFAHNLWLSISSVRS